MKMLDKTILYGILVILLQTEELRRNMDSDSSDDYDNCYFTGIYKHIYHG